MHIPRLRSISAVLVALPLGLACGGGEEPNDTLVSTFSTTLPMETTGTDTDTDPTMGSDSNSGDGDGDTDTDGTDTNGDAECGDGEVQMGEQCDLGPDNSATGQCTPECQINVCGDGYVYEGFEDCDDGNDINTDDCVVGCELASCGDGFVHEGVEMCDDGNDDETDECTSLCVSANCGDGVIQQGEQCDDGNMVTSDECPACQFAFCGDGYIQAGVEICDDGNLETNDECISPQCVPAACGDGFVWEGMEECDDDNEIDTDACTAACTEAFCGDGIRHEGEEECDDGNDIDDDFCSNDCISSLWYVEGVQHDIPEEMLGGWEECFTQTYNQSGVNLANLFANTCTGDRLLFACRPVNTNTYTVLAMGERADVLFDTGNGNVTHAGNGVSWYYSDSYSLGFVRLNDPVSRSSCDTNNTNPQDRLCWHSSGGNINGGWRCGSTTGLNGGSTWERKIFHAN